MSTLPRAGSFALREVLADGQARLVGAGVESPAHDARVLAAHVLGVEFGRLPLVDRLTPEQADAFDALIRRRVAREPLQHITGVAHFRRLRLSVGPGVFVPRPETEAVVGWCVETLTAQGIAVPVVVDLCAGSGAIACAVADELPAARVHAVEASPEALPWLGRNCAGHRGVQIHDTDIAAFAALVPELAGRVDLVVSNPPYVPDGAHHRMEPEVADHDPGLALWGGADGLDVVRKAIAVAHALVRPGGWFAVEHSDDQQARVIELLAGPGWTDVAGHRDLAGRDRFVTARAAVGE